MPEGPEVANTAKQLNEFSDSKIISLKITKDFKHQYLEVLFEVLPVKIISVSSYGKKILFHLRTCPENPEKIIEEDILMVSSLMMTGYWSREEGTHCRLILELEHGIKIFYNDVRNFGNIEIFCYGDKEDYLQNFGPDLLKSALSKEVWLKIFRSHNNKVICKMLLEGSIIAGIGNYLRAEILYHARINPLCKISHISDEELETLRICSHRIILESYLKGGLTISDYQNLNGSIGKFECCVYNRDKDPEGRKITKEKINGRSIYYVKEIQK